MYLQPEALLRMSHADVWVGAAICGHSVNQYDHLVWRISRFALTVKNMLPWEVQSTTLPHSTLLLGFPQVWVVAVAPHLSLLSGPHYSAIPAAATTPSSAVFSSSALIRSEWRVIFPHLSEAMAALAAQRCGSSSTPSDTIRTRGGSVEEALLAAAETEKPPMNLQWAEVRYVQNAEYNIQGSLPRYLPLCLLCRSITVTPQLKSGTTGAMEAAGDSVIHHLQSLIAPVPMQFVEDDDIKRGHQCQQDSLPLPSSIAQNGYTLTTASDLLHAASRYPLHAS